jgi:DNA mismatch repair protein MutS2
MARSAEEVLEFPRLREIVAGFTTCPSGRRAIEALQPDVGSAALRSEFQRIREAVAYLRHGKDLSLGSLADPDVWLKRLAVPASVLASQELLSATTLLDAAAFVRESFLPGNAQFPRLTEQAQSISDFRHLATVIRRAVLPNGEISDDASPELRRIRMGISQSRENLRKSLERILRSRGDATAEDYITLRNDRFVIPVRASEKHAIPGVVHGASATGQTIFVEPLESIELNNRLVQLGERELVEIARILEELTGQLRAALPPLEFAARTLAHIDSIFARARFAGEFDCVAPEFLERNMIRLESARNPVLEAALRPEGRPTVPLSLELGDSETVLVISGPNTGGKTVALKTVGLAALSAQSGIPVAAERVELPVFDKILADIGDEQSILANLSTFSAHMLNLKSMHEAATERSLILVDEMGTGTAPEEGAALAVALLEEFRARRCLTLATTHHDRLKTYASTTPGILNAAMEFDEENLLPTYRLLVGVPGTSSGIEIARRLGLPRRVIEHARAELSPESREAHGLIGFLHRSRDEIEEIKRQARQELAELESERRELRTEWVDRQRRRIAELEKSFQRALQPFEAEIASLASEIRDVALRSRVEKQSRRKLRKLESDARAEADAAVAQALAVSQADLGNGAQPAAAVVSPDLLAAGQRIRIKGFKQPVVLRSHDQSKAEIQAGPLRMKIPLTDIMGIEGSDAPRAASRPAPRRITVHTVPNAEPVGEEINVIGCTVEEAVRRVDKFLDQAVLASKPRVRIIHGHGTGALRRGLTEFLLTHPLVESIHNEAADRGGAAITVAELSF